jgi:hypothetical protein
MANSHRSCYATATTLKDDSFGSKMCSLSSSNFRSVSNWQRGSNGQGIAGYTVSQSIGNIVSPQDLAFRTQVAEATNLVTSSIL